MASSVRSTSATGEEVADGYRCRCGTDPGILTAIEQAFALMATKGGR